MRGLGPSRCARRRGHRPGRACPRGSRRRCPGARCRGSRPPVRVNSHCTRPSDGCSPSWSSRFPVIATISACRAVLAAGISCMSPRRVASSAASMSSRSRSPPRPAAQASAALRAANTSRLSRRSKSSATSRSERSRTDAPRRGEISTSPSPVSRVSASRTGIRDTPRASESSRSRRREPGGYSPPRLRERIVRSACATWDVPAPVMGGAPRTAGTSAGTAPGHRAGAGRARCTPRASGRRGSGRAGAGSPGRRRGSGRRS